MTPRRNTNDSDIDPVIAAELAALEAALAGAPDADPVLTALVEEVRADSPSMPLALRQRLDADVAAGFPRTRRGVGLLPQLTLTRVLPVGGALAAVVVAVVVAAGQIGGDDTPTSSSLAVAPALSDGDSAGRAAAPQGSDEGYTAADSAAGKTVAPEAAAATVAPGGSSRQSYAPAPTPAPGETTQRDRKVERSVDLTLSVGPKELQSTADGVVRTTQSFGGYVSDSQVSSRDTGGSATFTLRIPSAKLDAAIAKLSKLGHVAALDQSSNDITASFVSSQERLSDARQERSALLRALGKADSNAEIASLRARIASNRSQIAALKGELNALRRRADLSTVAVTIDSNKSGSTVVADDGDWSPGDAAGDALRVLEVAAGVALITLATLVPFGLLALLTALTARTLRRRQREHVLDTPAT